MTTQSKTRLQKSHTARFNSWHPYSAHFRCGIWGFLNMCFCNETTNFACSNLQDPQRFSAKPPLHYSVNSPYKYSKIFLTTCQKGTLLCCYTATSILTQLTTVMFCPRVEMPGNKVLLRQEKKIPMKKARHLGHSRTISLFDIQLPRAKQEPQKFPLPTASTVFIQQSKTGLKNSCQDEFLYQQLQGDREQGDHTLHLTCPSNTGKTTENCCKNSPCHIPS